MFYKTVSKCVLSSGRASRTLKQFYCHTPTHLKVNDIDVHKYITRLVHEYESLKTLTSSVLLPKQEQRLIELQPTMDILQHRNEVMTNIVALKDLLADNDPDIRKLAEEEKIAYNTQLRHVDEELLETLLPLDRHDSCDAIVLEVNTGVGGQEAMLFAKELFDMYCNFAQYKTWDVEVAGYVTTELGGLRHASALINGSKSFQYFKYEAGVHRVQRIPVTEKAGRIHTSTVSVLALPQPSDIEIIIDYKDLRIDTKKATGAGGQHVNTTDSAVRITHLPTSLSVECQVDRSQHRNKALAMQRLRALLYERKLKTQLDQIESTRKSQVRSNFRNEKIRTYNFGQDRITDHRLQGVNVHNLKGFFMGGAPLESLIEKLHKNARIESLLNIVAEVE